MKEIFTCLLLFSFLLNGLFLNAKDTFTITGQIDLNNTYDLDVLLDRMEKADIKSVKEYSDLFFSLRKKLPRIGYDKVTVYLSGNGKSEKTKVNQYGRFRFDHVPCGEYTITAEVPFKSSRKDFFLKKLSASTVVSDEDTSNTNLSLNMEGVTLKGRLINQNGNPIAGGEIVVTDTNRLHILKAISNHKGDFILSGIPPVTFFFVSNYLSENKVSLRSLMKEIQISAEGYKIPEKYYNLEMLMISEDMVARAKRFISISEQILKRMGTPKEIKIQDRTFPTSQGNTILLGDIVLNRK